MPRPEPYEKLMQEAPSFEARRELVASSFQPKDLVSFFKDGIELEGTVSKIQDRVATIKTLYGDFVAEVSELFYQQDRFYARRALT